MIAYTSILKKIHDILTDGLDGINVELSPTLTWDSTMVGIELEAQENRELYISNPDPYYGILQISIIVSEFSPDGVLDSLERRDALVGRVFDLLNSNRDLGGLVCVTQIGDIKFDTARTNAGFNAAAIIPLRAWLIS